MPVAVYEWYQAGVGLLFFVSLRKMYLAEIFALLETLLWACLVWFCLVVVWVRGGN